MPLVMLIDLKADFRRWLLLIFVLLLFLCACTAENSEVAAEGTVKNETVESIVREEESHSANLEATPPGSSEVIRPIPEGSAEGLGVTPSADQPAAQAEKIGNYTLVKGEKYPICREFLENLNYFKGKGETPMACDMRIAPQFKKFRTLNWENMPIDEEFLKNLIYDRFSNESKESQDSHWKQFHSHYFGKYKYPNVELSISKAPVHMFKDGRKSYALRQRHNKNWCNSTGPAGGDLFILADDMRLDQGSSDNPFFGSGGDLFYYDGKIRNFETWFNGNINPRDPARKIYPAVVRLYDIIEGTSPKNILFRQEICVYTYE